LMTAESDCRSRRGEALTVRGVRPASTPFAIWFDRACRWVVALLGHPVQEDAL